MPTRASYDGIEGPQLPEFEALVEQYYAPLYRFAMSLTRREADAADLVQDTFVSWAAKGGQLQDYSKVKAWLFTTLHRAFLQSQRRLVRFPPVEISAAEPELPQVPPAPLSGLDAQHVLDLLAKVDVQYHSAVALFYLEDYSYAEIADILGIPVGTVKSRIARGLAQLKERVLRATALHVTGRKVGA